ncbi:hypothetical protein [Nocardia sp. NPDC050413]|uniref:DUF7144 family membrane protein n=1 Tax=Nocardia sp. NPDC050413 TaxID=3155784 RepID=UPI0033FA1C1E
MTTNPYEPHPVRQGMAAGITMLAAILLLVAGIVAIVRGIAGVVDDDVLFIPVEYVYDLDSTTWGWIHIVLGVLTVAVAIGLMLTATWARVVALTLTALSIIANFLSLPYYPAWSALVILIDIVIIWAIATWQPYRL